MLPEPLFLSVSLMNPGVVILEYVLISCLLHWFFLHNKKAMLYTEKARFGLLIPALSFFPVLLNSWMFTSLYSPLHVYAMINIYLA